jgi:HPt (histidine-containing phosphotransfer) domain-containing protein
MTVKECYAMMNGGYEEVMGRLMKEERVKKFALKFVNDTSFELLKSSLETGDGEAAFRAAHTLKGVCQNLAFNQLYESSHKITEALRSGISKEAFELFPQVETDYKLTIEAIKGLE